MLFKYGSSFLSRKSGPHESLIGIARFTGNRYFAVRSMLLFSTVQSSKRLWDSRMWVIITTHHSPCLVLRSQQLNRERSLYSGLSGTVVSGVRPSHIFSHSALTAQLAVAAYVRSYLAHYQPSVDCLQSSCLLQNFFSGRCCRQFHSIALLPLLLPRRPT